MDLRKWSSFFGVTIWLLISIFEKGIKSIWALAFLVVCALPALAQDDCNCFETTTDLTVTNGQSVVLNAYYPSSSNALAGSTSITLDARRTFTGPTDLGGTIVTGDLLMVIQMQGAEINTTLPDVTIEFAAGEDIFTTSDYGDGPGGLDHAGFLDNGSFIAGQYEFVVATNDVGAGGGTLNLKAALTNSYISNATPSGLNGIQTFQVVKVGNFNNLTIDAGGEVTTVPWNGATGGIISLDVLGELDFNGTIDANFAGFRGGLLNPAVDNSDPDVGFRGEGIVGRPDQVFGYNDDFSTISGTTGLGSGYPGTSPGTSFVDVILGGFLINDIAVVFTPDRGIGGPGSAGGSGLLNNGGGGGSSGGEGGSGAASGAGNNTTDFQPAAGGGPLELELGSRIFLGGGGGSGGETDLANTTFPVDVASGRPGGGIVLLRADTILTTSTGTITANGDSGNSFEATDPDQDNAQQDGSGGGGGGGGTVIIITSTDDLSLLTINAVGGDGASMTGIQQFLSPDGGGGGGGGGNVSLVRRGGAFSALPTTDVSGGAAGATQGTPDIDSEGGDGAVSLVTTPPAPNLDCPLIALPAPSPGGVPGSIIWFNPNENVTFNGTNQITAWNDFSSSNFTLTNTAVTGITGTTPDFVSGSFTDAEINSNPDFNFNPSISFNEGANTTDYLAFNNFTNISTSAITTFAVVNFPVGSPNDQTVYSYLPNDSQDDEFDLGISDDSGADGVLKRVLDNSANDAGDLRDGITRIVAIDYNTTDLNIYQNNGAATTTALSGVLDPSGFFVLGQDLDDFATPAFDNARELQGQIGDIFYFSRVIDATERQQVSSFLAIRYGITLDQAGPQDYLNSIGEPIYPSLSEAANYASFRNDIAGLGRDDASRLSQLRSRSINSDAIITGSQPSGFAVDRQFVVWGNDNGALDFNTTEISAGINTRLQREWRVATSNSPDAINLSFNLSGVTNLPAIGSNVALVIDDDGDFSNGFLRTVSANSYDGTTATFENVTLNDDEVLTIAAVPETPGGVSNNLTLWLRADNETFTTGTTQATDGQAVNTWADQSVSGNDATSAATGVGANDAAPPTFVENAINFNPAVNFDGADDDLRGAAGFNTAEYFIVFAPAADITSTSGSTAVIGFDNTQALSGLFLGSTLADGGGFVNEVVTHIASGATASAIADATLTLSGPTLVNSRLNSAGDNQDVFLDGLDQDNLFTATAANFTGDFILGDNPDETVIYQGLIAEVISYSSRLGDIERSQVESYLAIKYGVTLDGNATDYIASDGDFIYETVIAPADYNNDIAGIGRDDVTTLNQTISLSESADAIVTVALTDNGGTFAAPNSFTNNLSFFAWGNDNDDGDGVIEDINTGVPSNVLTRLDRQWRIQEKGTVGNVTMQIDISGVDPFGADVDFTGRTAEDFLILVETGGDFTSGLSQSFAITSYDAVNEIITFEGDFVDGDIFTLATSRAPNGPGGVINNLQVWLRPDRGALNAGATQATDGEEVATWTDQFGGLDFTNNVIGALVEGPTFIGSDANFNGNPAFDWNATGNDDHLGRANFAFPATDFTLFTSQRVEVDNNTHLLNYFETGRILELRNLDALNFEVVETNANSNEDILGFTSLTTFEYTQGTPSVDINVNGTASASNPLTTASTGALAQNGTLVIGSRINDAQTNLANARQLVGRTGDVILYNGSLTADERNRVESYLAIKYGVTLANGDFDYVSADGTVTFPGNSDANFASHRTDVAGIGRDDLSDFEQLASRSVNTSSSLQVTKTASFDADGQYFVWGHNGTAVAGASSSDVPSGIESRLGRVWRVNTTNAPSGDASFAFDLTGVTVDAASDLRILIDADGTFSDATVLQPTVVQNGDVFTFSGVDLSNFSDDDFFTVASIDVADSPLPLDFLGFTVTTNNEGGSVLLEWQTTNEINVSHFEIQRSSDAQDFETIGTLAANNIANGINEYEFTDRSPLNNINYYRIKQLDFDGQFDFSVINFAIVNGQIWEVTIFPNPATDQLSINTNLDTTGRLRVVDLNGKVIMDYPTQDIRLNRLDISGLPAGTYIFQFQSVLGVIQQRFVKQ